MSTTVKVDLKAVLQPSGSVVCQLSCDGQEATVTFTGTEVLLDVPEPAQTAAQALPRASQVTHQIPVENPATFEVTSGDPVADYFREARNPPQ